MRYIVVGVLIIVVFASITNASSDLWFNELALATEVRGYEDFDLPEKKQFAPGQRAWIYFEVQGFKFLEKGNRYQVTVDADLEFLTSDGRSLFNKTKAISYDEFHHANEDLLWFYFWINIPRWIPRATYIVNLVVHDRIGGGQLSEFLSVVVK